MRLHVLHEDNRNNFHRSPTAFGQGHAFNSRKTCKGKSSLQRRLQLKFGKLQSG